MDIRGLRGSAGMPTEQTRRDGLVYGGDDGAPARDAVLRRRLSLPPRPPGRPPLDLELVELMVADVTRALEKRLGRPLSEILAAGVLRRGRRRKTDQALADDLAVRVAQAVASGARLRTLARALGVARSKTVAELARRGEELLRRGCDQHDTFLPDCERCWRLRLEWGAPDPTDYQLLAHTGVEQRLSVRTVKRDGRWCVVDANGNVLHWLRESKSTPADVLGRPRPWRSDLRDR